MSAKKLHFEPYLYLPALTHNAAIIAWGGFYFEYKVKDGEEKWEDDPVEDNKLPEGRKQSIGVRSESYGSAQVEVTEVASGARRLVDAEPNANHAVLRGLKPDTEYRYRVLVKGLEWAVGPRRDWNFSKDDEGGMWLQGASKDRQYNNVFRTFPAPNAPANRLAFAVIGDFGQGMNEPSDENERMCQRQVAKSLEKAVDDRQVRFILTTGDNIYADRSLLFFTNDEGEEDDDWFFTYFQPYRYVINRVPVFPVIGNHDTKDTEREADRSQIYDNLYFAAPFRQLRKEQELQATEQGLFYRFNFGSDIEFFCLDTSSADDSRSFFETQENLSLLNRLLDTAKPAKWRIAYAHHPPYCAGPRHSSLKSLQKWMRQTGRAKGIRVFFSGHEHNFQYAQADDAHYFLTGGGGKFRRQKLGEEDLKDAQIQAWGGNDEGHFLLVEMTGDRLEVTPLGHLQGGQLREININPVAGQQLRPPFAVAL